MLSSYCFATVVLLPALLLNPVHAAELGDPVIRSHIGQPLIADIELNTLADPGTAVTVRMAHADVYKGANIGMNPVLSSVNMSVMKRDGRQFLHITSIRPVSSENVHLFLELTDGGKRNVRAVTLWLTPDPTPAPPPPPVAAPVAAPLPVPAPVAKPAPRPLPAAEAAPRPVRVLTLPPAPVAPATCPQPQFTADQIKACEVLDEKNVALSAQIVDLEAKVRLLQQAIEGKPVAAPVAEAATAGPPPILKKKAKKEESGFPWLLAIGLVALIAALGGGVWHYLRRRKGKATPAGEAVAAPAGSPTLAWHQRLLTRLKRAPRAAASAETPPPPAA